jgi:hypothetical protein
MKNRLLRLMMLALVTGPMVAIAAQQGPIVIPTGPGAPDSTEIGEDPPPSPKDPGNIQPPVLTVADASGPIVIPTVPGAPDSGEIGDKPPPDPDDTGGIWPGALLDV